MEKKKGNTTVLRNLRRCTCLNLEPREESPNKRKAQFLGWLSIQISDVFFRTLFSCKDGFCLYSSIWTVLDSVHDSSCCVLNYAFAHLLLDAFQYFFKLGAGWWAQRFSFWRFRYEHQGSVNLKEGTESTDHHGVDEVIEVDCLKKEKAKKNTVESKSPVLKT